MFQYKGISLLDVLVEDAISPNIGVDLLGQDHLVDFVVGGGRSYRLRDVEAFTVFNGGSDVSSIVVIGSNMFCNTLHRCHIAVCLLVVGAIEYESVKLRRVALELGEGLAWRRFEVVVSFDSRFVSLAIASSSGFARFVLGFLGHVGNGSLVGTTC